jgi:manganese transport protein
MADGASLVRTDALTDATRSAAREALAGRRRGVRGFLPFAGPAIIASIAYIDPGNFATNIQGGAQFGYLLLWVVVLANVLAMLFQALSAKIGIVTDHSLPELCRKHFPRPLVLAMWVVSEIAAMATDLAETLGAAIGLSLLFGLSLTVGLLITFVATLAILTLQSRGFRAIEVVIAGFVGVISVCYLIQMAIAPPDWAAFAFHSVVPQLAGPNSVVLAVGIIGATVMPHAIYLHSSLVQHRIPTHSAADRRRVLSYSNREVVMALGVAGLVNMAMLAVAATVFHEGHADVATIETAYHTLVPLLGAGAGVVFMIALLASGISSSVVGTMAGQVIMQDFVGFRIPLWLRRTATMLPALAVVAMGVQSTAALVLSQVVLSMVLPVPMIALVVLSGRRDIMGEFANSRRVQVCAIAATVVVLGLNVILLAQSFGISLPIPGFEA